jgi:L-histidine N-alpha-methyltransferase
MTTTPTTFAVHVTEADLHAQLRHDVAAGLTASPKWLVPRWFYDAEGSRLFDEITRLPEYYLARAETSILQARAGDIARASGARTIVELGSGYSTKTRLLIDAQLAAGTLERVVGFDVSIDALEAAMSELESRYSTLELAAIAGDYHRHLQLVPRDTGRRMLVFLGSTIGNLIPEERTELLSIVRDLLQPGECFLVGTDLVKDPAVLEAAYDDAAGVTARFNRNVLRVIERRLGATIDHEAFAHEATWVPADSWVQVALRATRPTQITVPGADGHDDLVADFVEGERILTEVSTKFTVDGFAAELAAHDLEPELQLLDDDHGFALHLARRRG